MTVGVFVWRQQWLSQPQHMILDTLILKRQVTGDLFGASWGLADRIRRFGG